MGWIRFAIDETHHVTWLVRWHGRDHYRHAIGDGEAGTRVTEDMAEQRFTQSVWRSCWLPVWFPARTLMDQMRSRNCVTAAVRAWIRGWFYLG
jgi:hypothetical protein